MLTPRAFSSRLFVFCVVLLTAWLAGRAALIAPPLVTPPHQATDVATSITLTWQPVPDAQEYQVMLAYLDKSFIETYCRATSHALEYLRYNTCYSWRVRAIDKKGTFGPWSATWSFTTTATVPANTPGTATNLTAPAPGVTDVDTSPTLSWTPVPGATNYSIFISPNPGMDDPGDRDGSFVQGYVEGTSWKVPSLFGKTRFYWRVRGTYHGMPGPWSDISSFTTRASTEHMPPAPVLVTPADGETNLPLTIKARWQGQQAAYYLLEFATQANKDKGEWMYAGQQFTLSYPFICLTPNTCYFWRVRSINSAGGSAWTIGSFTTGAKEERKSGQ